jgi:hypothetical protein
MRSLNIPAKFAYRWWSVLLTYDVDILIKIENILLAR